MPLQESGNMPEQKFIDQVQALHDLTLDFVARERREAVMFKWLPRRDRDLADLSDGRLLSMAADALLLAGGFLAALPSASGATAFDRMAKRRRAPEEAEAIAALCGGRFRLLRLEAQAGGGATPAFDVCSGEIVHIAARGLPPLPAGTVLFGRAVVLGANIYLPGAVTPLDGTAALVARKHPSAGAAGGARWAEAVYAHVVRHGTLDVPGLNRPHGFGQAPEALLEPWQDALLDLLTAWQTLGAAAPDAALLQITRQSADLAAVLHVLGAAAMARRIEEPELAASLERVLAVQLEAVRDRAASWPGALTLDIIGQALDDAIATKDWRPDVKTLFETLRARLEYVPQITHAA